MSEARIDEHIEELKSRLKHSVIVFVLLSSISLYFSPGILSFIQNDLGVKLHSLAAYDVVYTEIQIALILGIVSSLPVFYIQFLGFLKPGLRAREYRILRNYLPLSIVLFCAGSVFAYNFIVKAALEFFSSSTASTEIIAVWGLKNTLSFVLKISSFTGVMFQLPIAALVLSKAGLLDRKMMKDYRRYFIILVMFLAAVVTPPDIISQILLVLPVLVLYQISIYLV